MMSTVGGMVASMDNAEFVFCMGLTVVLPLYIAMLWLLNQLSTIRASESQGDNDTLLTEIEEVLEKLRKRKKNNPKPQHPNS